MQVLTATEVPLDEIDVATAPAFLAAMREMIDWAVNRAVVVDCSAITFMDSAAYHALISAHEYALDQDHLLVLRGLRPNCARLIGICDPGRTLTLSP